MTSVRLAFRTVALASLMLLAACAGPPATPPVLDLPPGNAAIAVSPRWWTAFGDKTLDALVDEALAANLDLRLAIARVDEARGLAAYARSSLFPSVDFYGDASRSRISGRGTFPLPPGTPLVNNDFRAGFTAGYEVDLWGRIASGAAASNQNVLASEYARETVRIAVASEVARSYFMLRAAEAEIALLESTLATRVETAALQRDRFDSGVIGEYDYRQAEAERAAVVGDLAVAVRLRDTLQAALAVLAGRSPKEVYTPAIAQAKVDPAAAPPAVPPGLPSDLLARRPDIRRAEAELAAADYRVSEARAQYFPSLILTGSLGGESTVLADLLTAPARVWSIGAAIAQPIVAAGRIGAQVDTATARREQAIIAYQRTVQAAFQEAHDAFVAASASRQALAARALQRSELERAYALSDIRYRSGYSPYLEVLDAQRNLLRAQTLEIVAARESRLAIVDVNKALGGGWSAAPR